MYSLILSEGTHHLLRCRVSQYWTDVSYLLSEDLKEMAGVQLQRTTCLTPLLILRTVHCKPELLVAQSASQRIPLGGRVLILRLVLIVYNKSTLANSSPL